MGNSTGEMQRLSQKTSTHGHTKSVQKRTASAKEAKDAWDEVDKFRQSMEGRKMRPSLLLIREARRG